MASLRLRLTNLATRLLLKSYVANTNIDPVKVRKFVEGKGKLKRNDMVKLSHSHMEVRGNFDKKLAVLYVPGGGFCFGPHDGYREFLDFMCENLSAKGFLLNYRLAPENPFPAGYNDTLEAIRKLSRDKYSLIIMSDSAGCALALAALMHGNQQMRSSVKANVYMSGMFDLAITGLSTVVNSKKDPGFGPEALIHKAYYYLNGHSPCDPKASPFWGNFKGLSPSFFIVGGGEVLLDDSRRSAEKGKASKCQFEISIYQDAPHIFPINAKLPEARKARQEILAFVRRNLS